MYPSGCQWRSRSPVANAYPSYENSSRPSCCARRKVYSTPMDHLSWMKATAETSDVCAPSIFYTQSDQRIDVF